MPNNEPTATAGPHRVVTARYEGPIPPPEALRKYEEIIPGSADRIFRYAETQAAHRQWCEKRIVAAEADTPKITVFSSTLIVLTCIVTSTIVMLNGHLVAGGFLVGGALVPIVGFIMNINRRNHNERKPSRKAKSTLRKNRRR